MKSSILGLAALLTFAVLPQLNAAGPLARGIDRTGHFVHKAVQKIDRHVIEPTNRHLIRPARRAIVNHTPRPR